MRRTKWKRGKAVLPLLLSALMIVEPIGASTVYAEEMAPLTETVTAEQDEETEQGNVDSSENKEQETTDESKGDSGQSADVEKAEGESEGSDSEQTGDNADSSENPAETGEDGDGQEPADDVNDEEGLPDEGDMEESPEEDIEPEDTVSENDLETEEDEEKEPGDLALNGFQGMPSSYKLTAEQKADKKSVAAHAGEISGFQEGSDYVKGEVVTTASSQEEAEMIAAAYNAEIQSFEYGVLTLKLGENIPVGRALMAAADANNNLPAVWPNYYRHLMEETVPENSTVETVDGMEIETTEYDLEETAEASYQAAAADEYLNPDSAYYQWHHTVIGSTYAWVDGYDGHGVKVAVLDSGVAANSDLPTGITSLNDTARTDSRGHGTHVAGIIGARANGSLGAGVAPEAELYAYNLGGITSADIMKGINAARTAGVDVINMSVGGLGYVKSEQDCVDAAYEDGIAIFASAGNDGGQTYSYPACYDHVISVAATDKNNERASFSTYNNKVDLSAPGVGIWSTSNTNLSGYVSMQGTSMACPVAAGEAAVILSGAKALSAMQNADGTVKTGAAKVDALEALMKKNAVKAGSGMGSGITSLTKVFGLSTAAAKPAAPTITITPDDEKQSVTVTITAKGGATIYYTKNGKNPSFKNGEADTKVETEKQKNPGQPETFTIDNAAKATIKAIAVNENGVSSAVKSASYTLKPYVTDIKISGVSQVAKGKSIQLTAAVTPAYATNKKVTWELRKGGSPLTDAEAKNLSISASGKITATKDAVAGEVYQVWVTAQDSGKKSVIYPITVIDAVKVKSVKFVQTDESGAKTAKTLSSIKMTVPGGGTWNLMENLEMVGVTGGTGYSAADFKWTSSNDAIATVTDGIVNPKKAGAVTITALANDSSGKKATVKVTVTQLAEEINVTGPAKVARSKSAAFKAELLPAGVSNKKVKWELLENGMTEPMSAARAKTMGVSINANNGKVTATKNATPGTYTVKATTLDGSGLSDTATIIVTEGIINKISFPTKADANVKIFRKTTGFTGVSGGKNTVTVTAQIEGNANADLSQYTVTNSNPGIAAYEDTTTAANKAAGTITLAITATGKAAGTTKITIASADGSNKKLTCTVKVVNPVSGITIAPSAGANGAVAQGKSLQLKARVEAENGAVSDKKVTWELYEVSGSQLKLVGKNEEKALGIKISASGKVTADRNAVLASGDMPKSYVVKATAKDGSGVSDSYAISVAKPATAILIELLDPETGKPVIDPETKKPLPPMSSRGTYRIQQTGEGYVYLFDVTSDLTQGGFTVSSSNPAVASVTYEPHETSPGSGRYYVDYGILRIGTHKAGNASITVKAMDGSGKQMKINFKFY